MGARAVATAEAEAREACRTALGGDDPGPVRLLQPGSVSATFRIGPDASGRSIVAKRLGRGLASEERVVYERVLPRLPISVPGFLGALDEAGASHAWIFLEDLGPANYRPSEPRHRRLAARWLASLHGTTAGMEIDGPLPDLGPPHRRARLGSGRDLLAAHTHDPRFDEPVRAMITDLIAALNTLEERWKTVEEIAALAPRVLLHGDFVRKNLRLRSSPESGERLVAFDWGETGWGPPAFDLAQGVGFSADPDLEVYRRGLGDAGIEIPAEDLSAQAWLGTVFRAVTGTSWAAESLATDWYEDAVRDLGVYRDVLRDRLSAPIGSR